MKAQTTSPVTIIFTCTQCGKKGRRTVPWGAHHCLPKGWRSRDIIPTFKLARRTDHIFGCSESCCQELDKKFPPPKVPKWFSAA